eukprot:SAG31_NODE_64_length_28590_cov_17.914464_9_plen_197_part_00
MRPSICEWTPSQTSWLQLGTQRGTAARCAVRKQHMGLSSTAQRCVQRVVAGARHTQWHAGFFTMQQTPHARGFSTSLGFLYGVDHWTQQSFDKVCKYGDGGNSTDLWYIDRPAWGMNGTYGDYIYVGHAVETIMQHNASAAPLFYYLAYAAVCVRCFDASRCLTGFCAANGHMIHQDGGGTHAQRSPAALPGPVRP